MNTPYTAPLAARCEWSNCRRPATHRVVSCDLYFEDFCSSHVAPAIHAEVKWVPRGDITTSLGPPKPTLFGLPANEFNRTLT